MSQAGPLTLLTLALLLPLAHAQTPDPRIPTLLDGLARVRTPDIVDLSPDASTLAWAYNGPDGAELHLTGIAPPGSAQDGAWDRVLSPDTLADVTNNHPGDCASGNPAWSPDGTRLAFLSFCTSDSTSPNPDWQPSTQPNLFVWTSATNAIRQISHLHGTVSSLAWSPDGKSIAFLYVENATRAAGALDAMKPPSGVIGEDGIEVQRIATIDLASATLALVTPTSLHVYEFAFNPAASEIAYIAAHPPGENNWWVAQLYTQGLTPHTLEVVPDPIHHQFSNMTQYDPPASILDPANTTGPLHNLQLAVPRFSPDGKSIAFIAGLMSDQGATGGDIYLIPSTGGTPRNLTPNRPASAAFLHWRSDRLLDVVEHTGGSTHITALLVPGITPETTSANGTHRPAIDLGGFEDSDLVLPAAINATNIASSLSFAHASGDPANTIAFIQTSFDHPPEVWAGSPHTLKQFSHLNDKLTPAWGKAESIDWTSDKFHLQGWLLYPAGWTPADAANGKKYPLIVSVHGGPSSAVTPRWPSANYGGVPFSALGYFVFMPNPRGSYGQGEAFTQANVKDFGYGDLRDILAGLDTVEKRFPIDPSREGLTGWSYGGFMTMFAVTQTNRFRAAVAGAGIANWQSYYGENSIDQWMTPFFGASVYDVPAVYARSSPITFIKQAKTPTLIVVGDRDGECPAPQSFEFWHALRAQGVKTQLVVYPAEGHHFTDPAHQRDVLERALTWFQTEMPPK